MSYNIQEAVEDWVLSVSQSERQLPVTARIKATRDHVRKAGQAKQVVARGLRSTGVLGDRGAGRKSLRKNLLQKILSEDDGTFVQTSNWNVHPLDVVLKSVAVFRRELQ